MKVIIIIVFQLLKEKVPRNFKQTLWYWRNWSL